jgi:hypothetical protein
MRIGCARATGDEPGIRRERKVSRQALGEHVHVCRAAQVASDRVNVRIVRELRQRSLDIAHAGDDLPARRETLDDERSTEPPARAGNRHDAALHRRLPRRASNTASPRAVTPSAATSAGQGRSNELILPAYARRRVAFGRRFSRSGAAWGWLRERVKWAVLAGAGVGVLAYGATAAEALEHKRPQAAVEVTLADPNNRRGRRWTDLSDWTSPDKHDTRGRRPERPATGLAGHRDQRAGVDRSDPKRLV